MENLSEGRWLRSAIAEAGFSVSAFARKAGVSRESLNKWFAQPTLQIRPDTLLKVLSALGYTSLKYLTEEVEMMESMTWISTHSRPLLQAEMTRKIMNYVRSLHDKKGSGGEASPEQRGLSPGKPSALTPELVVQSVAEPRAIAELQQQANAENISLEQLVREMLRSRKIAVGNRSVRIAASREGPSHTE